MLLRLLWRENRRRPLSLMLLALLGGGGSFVVVSAAVVTGRLETLIEDRLQIEQHEGAIVDVHPAAPEHQIAGMSFERPHLSQEEVAWLRALPEVRASRVLSAVPVPTTVYVRVPGLLDSNQFLALYGIPASDMPSALQEEWREARIDGPIPVIMNPEVITYYNLGMADRYGLPRLDPDILMDRTFGLLVGKDVFKELPHAFQSRIVVRGYDSIVNPWGIALPKHITDVMLERLFPDGVPSTAAPMQVRLRLASAADLETVRARVRERGMTVASPDPLAATVSAIALIGRFLVGGIALTLAATVVVATGAMAASIVGERERQIALYRQSGARVSHLIVIFGGGVTACLVAAALLGAGLAQYAIPRVLAPLVERLDLDPLVATAPLPQAAWLLALGLAILCGSLSTAPPIIALARRPLLDLVRRT